MDVQLPSAGRSCPLELCAPPCITAASPPFVDGVATLQAPHWPLILDGRWTLYQPADSVPCEEWQQFCITLCGTPSCAVRVSARQT